MAAPESIEAQVEFDLAGVLAQGLEGPHAVEGLERTVHQLHLDGAERHVLVGRGEALAHAVVLYAHAGDDGVLAALAYLDRAAPGQEFGIILYRRHQREHLFGAVAEKN